MKNLLAAASGTGNEPKYKVYLSYPKIQQNYENEKMANQMAKDRK